ncbi:hypothetical protein AVEN_76699-1 [Araneus ventricosus]|uniref:Reverse transcriptase domain-containing protein n=1 Tax=Araneus ventricosus TaxID=182803 RepID=A0A4Y2BPI8_ARAVE|nr:hypothetical protein AVEN_76699-1 [Araneus ventricosus]
MSETTGALFLDVAKAFDKIWHDGLLATLMRLSCSAQFIKITHSFLTSRNFRVRINNILSNPRPILSGCEQVSLLSSAVFNIYVNDIPNLPSCHLAIFADDTATLTRHKRPDIAVQALQTFVSQLARIVNAPWYVSRKLIHQDLEIDPALDFMKIISKKFFEKLPQIPNALLQLLPYDSAVPISRKRPRAMLDYTYESFPSIKRRRDVNTMAESPDP